MYYTMYLTTFQIGTGPYTGLFPLFINLEFLRISGIYFAACGNRNAKFCRGKISGQSELRNLQKYFFIIVSESARQGEINALSKAFG